jgi:hypothetical protein
MSAATFCMISSDGVTVGLVTTPNIRDAWS